MSRSSRPTGRSSPKSGASAQELVRRRMARIAERRHAAERLVERQRHAIVERQLLVVDDHGERQLVRGDVAPRILHDGARDLDPPLGDHGARGGARPAGIAREQHIQTHGHGRVAHRRTEQNRLRRAPVV